MKHLLFAVFLLAVSTIAAAQVPKSNHVVIVLEENHSYSSVIGSSSMPYLNSLASQYGLATQYYANTHPSIGNYLELTAGQIITNSDGYSSTITSDNIVRHLLTAGKTWKSYAESLPSVGYAGGDAYPYIRHHNPLSYFSDVVNSSVQKLNLVPFTHFAADLANNQLPQLSFVVPNMHHNAHDCPTGMSTCTDTQKKAAADSWLKTNMAPLLSNPAFQQDGILIVVFDEAASTDTTHGGGHVAAVVAGPNVRKGYRSTTLYQHQSVLRTILTALGSSTFPAAAATATPMSDMFGANSSTNTCTASNTGVTVCSPSTGATVGSPAHVTAAAKSSVASITTMRIYVDNVSEYLTHTSSIDTSLPLVSGTHYMVVQAWDAKGTVYKSSLNIKVP